MNDWEQRVLQRARVWYAAHKALEEAQEKGADRAKRLRESEQNHRWSVLGAIERMLAEESLRQLDAEASDDGV